mmetsp:Transcript_407/g.931  ORF Transcript_407/g.931 Transcript_407/m.931 type:complete len:206 (-) Transcript_407:1099-1716(-)
MNFPNPYGQISPVIALVDVFTIHHRVNFAVQTATSLVVQFYPGHLARVTPNEEFINEGSHDLPGICHGHLVDVSNDRGMTLGNTNRENVHQRPKSTRIPSILLCSASSTPRKFTPRIHVTINYVHQSISARAHEGILELEILRQIVHRCFRREGPSYQIEELLQRFRRVGWQCSPRRDLGVKRRSERREERRFGIVEHLIRYGNR